MKNILELVLLLSALQHSSNACNALTEHKHNNSGVGLLAYWCGSRCLQLLVGYTSNKNTHTHISNMHTNNKYG